MNVQLEAVDWLSFLPYPIAADILAHPTESPVGRAQHLMVVALFVDVSGFTALSDILSQIGRAGAEELIRLLNGYFQPLIQLVNDYGGSIGKFVGDALMILFPYTLTTQSAVVRRALQCALAMQEQMPTFQALQTKAGTFSLAMKAGLAQGSVFCTTVGTPTIRLEVLLGGAVLARCSAAESLARAGEIVASDELLSYAGDVQLSQQRDGFSWISGLLPPTPPQALPPLPQALSSGVAGTLAAYHHPMIAQRLRLGQETFINEHRRVTVLFMQFADFDYDHDPDVGAKLQDYLLAVMQCIQRYDGYIRQVEIGDKGTSKVMALWGAPVTHEDDEERTLRCALDLRGLSRRAGIETRMGVNSGSAFCGLVGTAWRREYTIIGDAVNLAARLMQAASEGQLLVSSTSYQSVARRFLWQPLPPLLVKGKSAPIVVYDLLCQAEQETLHLLEPEYTLPMVGRTAEREVARERMERVVGGQGQIIGVTAEAGMGKSRLVAEMVTLAITKGFTCYGGECHSYGTHTPYLPWQPLWRGFFGLKANWSLEAQQRHLESQLAQVNPAFTERLPLLGTLLGLALPENELSLSLDAKLRKSSLETLLVACLQARLRESHTPPMLLILEDCHWIDLLSQELVEVIGHAIRDLPLLLVLAYRSPEGEQARANPLTRFPYFTELSLAEFTTQEASRLVELKVAHLFGKEVAPPAAWLDRITHLAQGNPFYLDEMVNLLHDRGIHPQTMAALEQIDLPDSLHSLILSRVDQLGEEEKGVLKVASVIGRLFRAAWLWTIFPHLGPAWEVRARLETLSRLDITPLDKLEPELEYLFKHIITRDVAYESLPLTARAFLHEQIAVHIEKSYAGSLEQWVDLLAHHYSRSSNQAKLAEYLRRAGEAAQSAYANQAALAYYGRLLPLLPESAQGEIMRKMEAIYFLIGKWDEAEMLNHQALALAERLGDQSARAYAQYALGCLAWRRGAPEHALPLLTEALEVFERLADKRGRSLALRNVAILRERQSDYAGALAAYNEVGHLASELEDLVGMSTAQSNIGLVYMNLGQFEEAQHCFETQYQLALQSNHRPCLSHACMTLGLVASLQGQYLRAADWYARQLQMAFEMGDQRSVGLAVQTMGSLYLFQGESECALACFFHWLLLTLAMGDMWGIALSVGGIAQVEGGQGREVQAEVLFQRAIQLLRVIQYPYWLALPLYHAAALRERQQRYVEAQILNDEALELAEATGHKEITLSARLLATRLALLRGHQEAAASIAEIETLLTRYSEPKEQAAIRYEICRLDPEQPAHRQEAIALYRALYRQTPNSRYRERFEELSGEHLPEPPPLPPLPQVVTSTPIDRALLLKRVDELIATRSSS